MKRVLVVCESFSQRASGGRAAIALALGLREHGFEVHVATFCDQEQCDPWLREQFEINFLDRGPIWRQRLRQLIPLASVTRYLDLLRKVRPAVVHFASFDFDKPRFLYKAAKRNGAVVILQPWIYSAICAQGYGYRNGQPCEACFSGHFGEAVKRGCTSPIKGLIYNPSRYLVRQDVLKYADWVLSTCSDMDRRLTQYGFGSDRIVRLPLQYYPNNLDRATTRDGGAFVYHGQMRDFKGVSFLAQIASLCPQTKFLLFPFAADHSLLGQFGIGSDSCRNITVVGGRGWGRGLADEIAQARAILVPSLWPSSTEYALIEALSMAKPVAAFRVGAHVDYLIDGKNAVLAEPGDVVTLADGIRRLDRDEEFRRSIAENAGKLYDDIWSPATWRGHLATAYASMRLKAA